MEIKNTREGFEDAWREERVPYSDPVNKWVPPSNPMVGERGVFFKLAWASAHSAEDFKIKTKKTLMSHKKWDGQLEAPLNAVITQPAKDAACAAPPPPCMAGTIAATAAAAGSAGLDIPSVTNAALTIAAAAVNVTAHQAVVARLGQWMGERKKILCPPKKTSTNQAYSSDAWVWRPDPKVDMQTHHENVSGGRWRYITDSKTDHIDKLVAEAMALALAAQQACIAAQPATIAAAASDQADNVAFPLIPVTKGLVKTAWGLWKVANQVVLKSKLKTYDMTHEILKFERGRVMACSLPGKEATKMGKWIGFAKPPDLLTLSDNLRDKGHSKDPNA